MRRDIACVVHTLGISFVFFSIPLLYWASDSAMWYWNLEVSALGHGENSQDLFAFLRNYHGICTSALDHGISDTDLQCQICHSINESTFRLLFNDLELNFINIILHIQWFGTSWLFWLSEWQNWSLKHSIDELSELLYILIDSGCREENHGNLSERQKKALKLEMSLWDILFCHSYRGHLSQNISPLFKLMKLEF